MNIEQLKMILETLEGLGGDVKQFAIWYLALFYGVKALGFGCVLVGLWMVLTTARGVIASGFAGRRIAEAAGYTPSLYWGHDDTAKAIRCVEGLKKEAKR